MDENATTRAGPSSSNSNNNNNNEPPRKKRKPPPKKPLRCERYYDDYSEHNRPVWKRADWGLKKRHNTSLEASTSDVKKVGEGEWTIESFTSNQKYVLTEGDDCEMDDHCDDYCYYCATCIHKYDCTCPDFDNGLNMCKHIHLLCRFLAEEQEKGRDSNDDSDDDDDDSDEGGDDDLRETVDKEWSKIRQLLIDQEGVNIIKRGLEGIRKELNQHSSAKFAALRKKKEEKQGKKKTK